MVLMKDLIVEPYNIRVKIGYNPDPNSKSKGVAHLSERIDTLNSESMLYHATALHRLEGVLAKGLDISKSSRSDERGSYLCLTWDLGHALSFAYRYLPKSPQTRLIVGAVGLDQNKLPNNIKNQLEEDPLFKDGVITRESISPTFFSELILTDLEGDNYDLVETAKNIERVHKLPVRTIDYDLSTARFEFRQR